MRERVPVLRVSDLRSSFLVLFEFGFPRKNKNKKQKPAIKTERRERLFSTCFPKCLELALRNLGVTGRLPLGP